MCITYVYRCTICHKTVESMVELEECPYCGLNAWWDTWQEVQIIEKDENEEKKMQGWQDKVIEPRKKMTKKDILKKVKKLKEKNYYIRCCLSVRVCPGCGRDMSLEESIGMFFNCKCGFSTNG